MSTTTSIPTEADITAIVQALLPVMYYNGSEETLNEAVITGNVDSGGRLAYDMSGSPYSWTNVRVAMGSGSDSASTQWYHEALSANTGRIYFLDATGSQTTEGTAVTIILKGA